jgi:hypothetical protein
MGLFLNFFRRSHDFVTQKMYFSRIIPVYLGLQMLAVSFFFLVSGIGNISLGIDPCFPLAGGLCKFSANTRGKRPIQRQPPLVQYRQQANTLFAL